MKKIEGITGKIYLPTNYDTMKLTKEEKERMKAAAEKQGKK